MEKHDKERRDKERPHEQTGVAAKHGMAGHRARMRDRILAKGADTLTELELLEILLYAGNPRGDTKPLAKALMREFGSLGIILRADVAALEKVPKMGNASIAAIKTVEAAALYLSQTTLRERPILANWAAVKRHCVNRLSHLKIEKCVMICLDNRNRVITEHEVSSGTVDQTPVYTREVVTAALAHHASAVLLVHNHPSGEPEPSKADIIMTREIKSALSLVDIKLHDHLIVADQDCISLRALGHL